MTTEAAPRKKRRIAAVVMLVVVAAFAAATAWLGPPALWWSAVAITAPQRDEVAWRHVAADAPVLAVCDVRRLLASPIARAVRPQLEELSRRQGMDLGLAEKSVDSVIAAHDGEASWYGVATGVFVSPDMLPRFAPAWQRAAVPLDGAPASIVVTDGAAVLATLEPGLVLWAPVTSAAWSLRAARTPRDLESAPPVTLDAADVVLHLQAIPNDTLRATLARMLPPEAQSLAADWRRLDLRVVASDRLTAHVRLGHRNTASADLTRQLLVRLQAASQLARGAGALLSLLGPDAAVLQHVPSLEIRVDGMDVEVDAALDAKDVGAWLDRALTVTAPQVGAEAP